MLKRKVALIALAVVAVSLFATFTVGCTVKVSSTPIATPKATIASLIPPEEVTSKSGLATLVAQESATLSALIAQTTMDAQNQDIEAVGADCAKLKAASVQWNADLNQFDTLYPGALAAEGVDPTGAQSAVTSLLTSCALIPH